MNDLRKFLEVMNDEPPEIKKVISEMVKTYRWNRDPDYWSEQIKKLVSLGVNPQKLSDFMN